jgi:hypothetical protein
VGYTETDGLRRFDDPAIQTAIDRAMASIPASRKMALVLHAGKGTGASLSLVARRGDALTIAGCVSLPTFSLKAWKAEAKVVWSLF